jgi:hypothetical protein
MTSHIPNLCFPHFHAFTHLKVVKENTFNSIYTFQSYNTVPLYVKAHTDNKEKLTKFHTGT